MRTRWFNASLCLFVVGLSAILGTPALAQDKTPSVLERVQRVDDPELGELIRVAMEKRKGANIQETLEVMRKITLSYSQIRLLDQQVQEVSRKIDATTGPAEIRYELLLAKAELEAKLMKEMADLREVMGIVPQYPLVEKPLSVLNAWLHFQVLDKGVCVLDTLKPFGTYWGGWRFNSVGLLSRQDALDYIRQRVKDKQSLPIRIQIDHTVAMTKAAQELRTSVISVLGETHSAMEAEVDLKTLDWVGSGVTTFYLRDGVARTLYAAPVSRPDGGPDPLDTGVVEPNDIDQHIQWHLQMPGNVPLTFRVEYDKASSALADQIAREAEAVARRLNMAELVTVEKVEVNPIPEDTFRGRWQALGRGEIQSIDVYPDGVGIVTMGQRSPLAGAGEAVTCPWLLTTDEIILDPKEKVAGGHRYVFRGNLDDTGNLVVYRGMIYPQGDFHISYAQPTILEKVR